MLGLSKKLITLKTIILTLAMALLVPVMTSGYSAQAAPRDDDDRREYRRDRGRKHREDHRDLERKHRRYHRYSDDDDDGDHRAFHRYLNRKHHKSHRDLYRGHYRHHRDRDDDDDDD